MGDVTSRYPRRVVCKHGAECTLEFVTTRTNTGFTVKATQNICKLCLDELGADLAANNRAIVMEIGRRLQNI